MNLPLVSVIMSTYNHANFVKQSIESVLMQEGVNFEFLIADDGSVDSTRDVIASIKDERIKFFPNTINRGAGIVTNELINRATGEFIALINSDDYWSCSDKLAYQLKIMRGNPDIAACFGKANFVDKSGVTIDKTTLSFGTIFDQQNRSQALWLRRFFELGNCICHPTMLIRKSCYEDVGLYNNRLRQLPDFEMWIQLIKKYPIYISDRELIHFRILPGENASTQTPSNSIRTINEHYLIAENFFNDVTREQLIEGFSDYLVHKNILTAEALDIEKTLLYFYENQWLGKPYKMIGLLKMNQLLNSTVHRELLASSYDIDERWFHNKMGDVDVLISKLNANVSQGTHLIQSQWKKLFAHFNNHFLKKRKNLKNKI